MNEIQFKRLVDAVKWAIDDVRWEQGKWEQGHWGLGVIKPQAELIPARSGTKYRPVACTTGCCIAGNVTQNHGDLFVVQAHTRSEEFNGELQPISVTHCLTKEDRTFTGIEERAMELLGLDYEDMDECGLFDGENELAQIINYASQIADSHGHDFDKEIPASLYADLIA